jgi:hypothetical protein
MSDVPSSGLWRAAIWKVLQLIEEISGEDGLDCEQLCLIAVLGNVICKSGDSRPYPDFVQVSVGGKSRRVACCSFHPNRPTRIVPLAASTTIAGVPVIHRRRIVNVCNDLGIGGSLQ